GLGAGGVSSPGVLLDATVSALLVCFFGQRTIVSTAARTSTPPPTHRLMMRPRFDPVLRRGLRPFVPDLRSEDSSSSSSSSRDLCGFVTSFRAEAASERPALTRALGGGPSESGTETTAPQPGHLIRLPARSSRTFSCLPHSGHENATGMTAPRPVEWLP